MNYGQLWRNILLTCPFVPAPLAQFWIRQRYQQILDSGAWGGAVAQSQFIIPNEYNTGTITLVNNSVTVSGVGTAWTSALEGRQLYISGQGPYYTIQTVVDPLTITLQQAYGGDAQAGIAYSIVQAYVSPPSDFLSFKSIKDPVNNWRLRFNLTQEWLDRIDARRSTVGPAWCIVDYKFTSAGLRQFEVWPRVTTQRLYPYMYWSRPVDLSADSDTPIFPLRGDEILKGAMADLAKWPGTESRKNPAFDLRLASMYEAEFSKLLLDLKRVDQEIYLSDYIAPGDDWSSMSDVPLDSKFFQTHDF